MNKCVDSVINQTYSRIEIILVDDGSPDNCGKICDEYAQKDNRIKVIHQKNKGLPGARNTGIDIASGEYITFVDSDDFIHEKMVEILLSNLTETDSDISVCGYLMVNEDCAVKQSVKKENVLTVLTRENIPDFSSLSQYISAYSAWGKLFKSKLFDTVRFSESLRNMEDLNLLYKAYALADRICFFDDLLYYYLQRDNSILHSKSYPIEYTVNSFDDLIDFYENLETEPGLRNTLTDYLVKDKANFILDAYYITHIRKLGKPDKQIIRQKFTDMKPMLKERSVSTLKIRLFSISPSLFIIAMKLFILFRKYENEPLK